MEPLTPQFLLAIPLAPLVAAFIAGVFCSVIPRKVAAAESAIGLAILVVLFRERRTINVEDMSTLKG